VGDQPTPSVLYTVGHWTCLDFMVPNAEFAVSQQGVAGFDLSNVLVSQDLSNMLILQHKRDGLWSNAKAN